MSKSLLLSTAVAFATVFGAAGIAHADGSASYTINVTGYVPVICHINSNQTVAVTGSNTDLGDVNEFCNNPTGYQVWVDYAPGTTSASISVDGRTVALSSSGSTMIDTSNTAAIQTRHLTLNGGSGLSSVSIRIIPV